MYESHALVQLSLRGWENVLLHFGLKWLTYYIIGHMGYTFHINGQQGGLPNCKEDFLPIFTSQIFAVNCDQNITRFCLMN